jgi:hypothetical protein
MSEIFKDLLGEGPKVGLLEPVKCSIYTVSYQHKTNLFPILTSTFKSKKVEIGAVSAVPYPFNNLYTGRYHVLFVQ